MLAIIDVITNNTGLVVLGEVTLEPSDAGLRHRAKFFQSRIFAIDRFFFIGLYTLLISLGFLYQIDGF